MPNPLYELMREGESGAAGYNAFNRGTYADAAGRQRIRPGHPPIDFAAFTLGEVIDMQERERHRPDRVFAVGKYQIIPRTMLAAVRELRLERDQPFSPELQDHIFSAYLVREKQPAVSAYIEGREGATLRAAQHGLAREWASFGDPDNEGRSHYGGANRAHITPERSADALRELRRTYRTAIDAGQSLDAAWHAATSIDPAQRAAHTSTRAARQRDPLADGLLRRDERGPDIADLQRSLDALGVRDAQGNRLRIDGMFGQHTEDAVSAFQRAHALRVDGIAGPDTLTALGKLRPAGGAAVQGASVPGASSGLRGGGAQRIDTQATATGALVTDASHPAHALFAEIRMRLARHDPPVVPPPSDETVANVTLQAMENGITGPDRLRGLAVVGSDAHLQGPYEGARVSIDLRAPTADLRAMSDHMARQAAESEREQPLQRERSL